MLHFNNNWSLQSQLARAPNKQLANPFINLLSEAVINSVRAGSFDELGQASKGSSGETIGVHWILQVQHAAMSCAHN